MVIVWFVTCQRFNQPAKGVLSVCFVQALRDRANLGITVNAAFTPSADVLAADNKARGMLYFIKTSFTRLINEIFVPLYSALVQPHLEYAIQANCPKGSNTVGEGS